MFGRQICNCNALLWVEKGVFHLSLRTQKETNRRVKSSCICILSSFTKSICHLKDVKKPLMPDWLRTSTKQIIPVNHILTFLTSYHAHNQYVLCSSIIKKTINLPHSRKCVNAVSDLAGWTTTVYKLLALTGQLQSGCCDAVPWCAIKAIRSGSRTTTVSRRGPWGNTR